MLAQRGVHVGEDHALGLELLVDLVVDDLGLVLGADAGEELALGLGDAEPVEGVLDVLGDLAPVAAVLLGGADEVVDVVEVDLVEVAAPVRGRAASRSARSALRRKSRIHCGSSLYSEIDLDDLAARAPSAPCRRSRSRSRGSRTSPCSRRMSLSLLLGELGPFLGCDRRVLPCQSTSRVIVSSSTDVGNVCTGAIGRERLRPAGASGRRASRGGGTRPCRSRRRTRPRRAARRRASSGPRSRSSVPLAVEDADLAPVGLDQAHRALGRARRPGRRSIVLRSRWASDVDCGSRLNPSSGSDFSGWRSADARRRPERDADRSRVDLRPRDRRLSATTSHPARRRVDSRRPDSTGPVRFGAERTRETAATRCATARGDAVMRRLRAAQSSRYVGRSRGTRPDRRGRRRRTAVDAARSMAVFADPTGAVFGIWSPARFRGAASSTSQHTRLERAQHARRRRPRLYGAVFGGLEDNDTSEAGADTDRHARSRHGRRHRSTWLERRRAGGTRGTGRSTSPSRTPTRPISVRRRSAAAAHASPMKPRRSTARPQSTHTARASR